MISDSFIASIRSLEKGASGNDRKWKMSSLQLRRHSWLHHLLLFSCFLFSSSSCFFLCFTCTPFKSHCHPWKSLENKWFDIKKYVLGRDSVAQNWHSRGETMALFLRVCWGAIIMVMVWWSPVSYDCFSRVWT